MTQVLYGKIVADSIRQLVLSKIEQLPNKPTLATVGFSDNNEWLQYSRSVKKSAENYNCNVVDIALPHDCSVEHLCKVLENLNGDDSVDAVLLQQPLPKHLTQCVDKIAWYKDCDGLTAVNTVATFINKEKITPATPTAVIEMLNYYGVDLCGKNVVIIGRGLAVGKPLALMMTNRNATVTVCHTRSVDVPSIAKSADIVVAACGQGGMVDSNYVNQNSVVIDVGLSFTDGKMQGDVDQLSVDGKCKAYSPVPKGIGPVTQACLFDNVVKCAMWRKCK